jgi:hypothetical protein
MGMLGAPFRGFIALCAAMTNAGTPTAHTLGLVFLL